MLVKGATDVSALNNVNSQDLEESTARMDSTAEATRLLSGRSLHLTLVTKRLRSWSFDLENPRSRSRQR